MVVGDTGWIGGLTKVAIYPTCANLLKKVAVLATPIRVQRIQSGELPGLLANNYVKSTKGTQDNHGHMQLNK